MTLASACSHEAEILARRRAGGVDPFVVEHLAQCPSCREAVDVSDFLARTAAIPDGHRLPEASRVWFRAQLVRKWEAERRATAPIETMQHAERGLLVVVLAGLIWLWMQVGHGPRRQTPPRRSRSCCRAACCSPCWPWRRWRQWARSFSCES